MTLGHWAGAPDREFKDWLMRSTTLEVLQNPAVSGTIGVGVTVAVTILCSLGCLLLPFLCPVCPVVAVEAGQTVIDEIASLGDPIACASFRS